MAASARIMVPLEISNAMLGGSTSIAEPDTGAGESAWTASATYSLGDRKTSAGKVYECVQAHTGHTELPAADAAYWLAVGPTNRMAPFDDYSSTKATATTTLTYVINPGFCNGLALYELAGDTYAITVKDAPGGAVIASYSGGLVEEAQGFYELLFTVLNTKTQLSFDNLPLCPTPEITITLTASGSNAVAVGTIKVGDWRVLMGDGKFGGAQYGASAERKSYTYREYFDDGTYKTVRRPASRDVRCSVVIESEQAMYADAILAEVIDTAAPFEACGLPKYGYLNTLGFVSGTIQADTFGTTNLDLTVKGNI